jgi:hypothetical protein
MERLSLQGGVEYREASVEAMPSVSRSWGLITWVFCHVGEVEVYGLARRDKLTLG